MTLDYWGFNRTSQRRTKAPDQWLDTIPPSALALLLLSSYSLDPTWDMGVCLDYSYTSCLACPGPRDHRLTTWHTLRRIWKRHADYTED